MPEGRGSGSIRAKIYGSDLCTMLTPAFSRPCGAVWWQHGAISIYTVNLICPTKSSKIQSDCGFPKNLTWRRSSIGNTKMSQTRKAAGFGQTPVKLFVPLCRNTQKPATINVAPGNHAWSNTAMTYLTEDWKILADHTNFAGALIEFLWPLFCKS